MNAQEALGYARNSLRNASIEHAAREAALLLGWVLGWTPHQVYVHPERKLAPAERERLQEALDRRCRGEPVQYITGRQEFMSLEFAVGPGVLIPRPETEFLVEAATACRPRLAVDVGTGSGAIAVSLAVLSPDTVVYATDVDNSALEMARQNAARHHVHHRVRFFQGDLLDALSGQGLERRVDVVVSNPPYIPSSEWAHLPREVRDFEPRLALDGGTDGLEVYRRLVPQARSYLSPQGKLLLEAGAGQARAIGRILEEAGFCVESIRYDYAGIERVLQARSTGEVT
ncbi:MAG: peptide chain release factor N(5)-glutamine methyltransferase [Bacillota bacterium]